MHYRVDFCDSQRGTGVHWHGVHWQVSRVHEGKAHDQIGPQFRRVRVVVLCRDANGSYFLLCSCFLYQRVLYLCRHMAAVKRGNWDVFTDVQYRYHVTYGVDSSARQGLSAPACTDGQYQGPGVLGVKDAELQVAMQNVPLTRNGVHAWLLEGGLSWIPDPDVIWGRVTRNDYSQENESDYFPDEYHGGEYPTSDVDSPCAVHLVNSPEKE